MASCGGACHETAFIMANSDHADAGASKLGQGDNVKWIWKPG
jgi:hypothetical protein